MTTETRRPLTPKQERLADFYISLDGNAYQAAKAAGYSESFARVDVHKALANPSLQLAIAQRKAEIAAVHQLSPADVMAGLVKEARSGDSSASRVAAWRSLADILGMTSGRAGELPAALTGMLEALGRGLSAGAQARQLAPSTLEVLPSSRPAESEQEG